MSEHSFASLMDLAALDTSDLSAQTSRLQAEGIYVVEVQKIGFSEQPPQDPANPMNYNFNFEGNTLAYLPLENGKMIEGMEGRTLKQRIFLFGENITEAVQLLMGAYKTVGFRHKGPMGGVEGAAPGWADEALGKRIAIRVRHGQDKNGTDRAYYDWLSPKQLVKVGLTWEHMGREFLDEVGNPTSVAA